ncbi:LLM class flavin-dependent oxidoreductase [Frankia sp. AgB1.9]|uniref:LLM class flavin-dependent oxidoreductase n=1 Tax=unclassified Frankia TaxID=2632575 RepID=UPI001933F3E2|nr:MULTISPECIES: LLM class flavin-dependent oxidoreductase [unclassified Frankia]MBL7494294.1 LLM class flavin-dependent oxidoreductase [Frankia sp. AgW1.1]MBL7552515.1 LLM class flavin-dependent oxidoreductase [Frankia sp. AgB1.9]MBL7625280.1 LLM class flavin-dependent oxidoreductase [Frankia sp. AgB1.8]
MKADLDIGVTSLSDLQPVTVDGTRRTARHRVEQIVSLATLADELGLDHFGLGEHHSADFAVSSPAAVLSAVAARTSRVRLTSSVTTLGALDPVRVYQDFATLDLVSAGRAEIIVGRSAYPEPFALFGVDLAQYDEAFAEKLDLLLRIRSQPVITWRGRFRPPLRDAVVMPRAVQEPLPVWLGVGGTPASAVRAGRLGLPMILGYIGGTPQGLRQLADLYREAGAQSGHTDNLRLGIALHYFGTPETQDPMALYPYYRDFLRPKRPGAPGFVVEREQFALGLRPGQHLMIGTSERVGEKLAELYDAVSFDRVHALIDWGGLPEEAVRDSLHRLGEVIAPALRAHAGIHTTAPAT